jgi:putative membrane protein
VTLKFVIRGTVIWAIEVAALGLLTVVLPGVSVTDRQIGVVAALLIALLNALVRPIVLLFAQNLGLVLFGLISLLLNGLLVLLATRVLPGFTVDTLWTAFLLAFGLAVLNTLASALLGINDDDSFYRNVIRWLQRRRVPLSDLAQCSSRSTGSPSRSSAVRSKRVSCPLSRVGSHRAAIVLRPGSAMCHR